ncbi:MAG: hypothetical protein WKF30_09975, partial [Pyrinomonadaceae bacterium]
MNYQEKEQPGSDDSGSVAGALDAAIDDRLRAVKNSGERRTMLKFAREIRNLPSESALVAVEMSAAIAAISWRASAEFLRSVPAAASILTDSAEVRAWAEMGRRLTMGDVEAGAAFFAAGAEALKDLSPPARMLLFEVCARQMVLSSSFAVETFTRAATLARAVEDPELLRAVYETAAEVARRSAKHSADFLASTPQVAESFREFGAGASRIAFAAVELNRGFALKAGGGAAEVWAAMPRARP